MQEALVRSQVEAYAADPSAGASKGQSSIQIRRDWKAKEKQLQVGVLGSYAALQLTVAVKHNICSDKLLRPHPQLPQSNGHSG